MFNNSENFEAGTKPEAGIYKCTLCGKEFEIKDGEDLLACDKCHHKKFRKIS